MTEYDRAVVTAFWARLNHGERSREYARALEEMEWRKHERHREPPADAEPPPAPTVVTVFRAWPTCGKCGKCGHNKTTCEEPAP